MCSEPVWRLLCPPVTSLPWCRAEPTAQKFTDGQLKPAANKLAEEAVPQTEKVTQGYLKPGAEKLAKNAGKHSWRLQCLRPAVHQSAPVTGSGFVDEVPIAWCRLADS